MQSTSRTFKLKYLKTMGYLNTSSHGRGFGNPMDLVVGADGRIFILNRGEVDYSRVAVCTLDEEHLYDFGTHGDGEGQFRLPTSIAMDSRERVYVADEYNHRITIFEPSGEYLGNWGGFGTGDGQLDGPSGLAFDAEDNVYVVDQNNNRVQKFTSEGEYLLQWGEPGDGEGQFNLPWGITLDSHGDVYVADWRNDRIQKFTPEGRYMAEFGESGEGDRQFRRPADVVVDQEGYIYVADWGNERVQVLGPDGAFVMLMRGESTYSKWAQEFWAANPVERDGREKANLIPQLPSHFNTPYLVSAATEPYFLGAVSVDLDQQGRLYVTESPRHRFQIYERG